MTANVKDEKPPLAALVQAGESQTEAVEITDFIFMAKDISNAYLVTASEGDLLINTGFHVNAGRTKQLFEPVRTGPLRYIIVTQSHPDHYGGVPVLREPGTEVIAEQRYLETCDFYRRLRPFSARRSGKLWSSTLKRDGGGLPPEPVSPDLIVDGRLAIELRGRRFEILSTPGGETVDSLTVWMPNERVVFTGNLFGPVFLSMPFLTTIRGDKPRSVDTYLDCLDRVRALDADLLITGHGEPIRGGARIRADLDKLYAAVAFVRDATVEGMNAGTDVHTLMRDIRLPEELSIGEFHGKVSWAVRAIWEGYSGWFHYDSTTSLYGVPRSSIDQDLAELAGGAGVLARRARERLEAGQLLEALHLLDIALGAEPDHGEARSAKKDALGRLLAQSGGANLSETMWLRSELEALAEP